MKRVDAIIRPSQLNFVREALDGLGYGGITVSEVKGHGKQRGITEQWRGREYKVEYLSKVWILLVVNDADLEKVLATIVENARTGEIGDGKIFVSDVQDVVRVRTGERAPRRSDRPSQQALGRTTAHFRLGRLPEPSGKKPARRCGLLVASGAGPAKAVPSETCPKRTRKAPVTIPQTAGNCARVASALWKRLPTRCC